MKPSLNRWMVGGFIVGCLVVGLMVGCEVNNSAATDTASATLGITPSSVTLSSASTTNIQFTAAGGVPPYSWSVSDSNGTYGVLAANDDIAIYTPTAAAGGVFVSVTDSTGTVATATIVQN